MGILHTSDDLAGQPRPPGHTGRRRTGPKYNCTYNASTDAFTGADGTASAIGWEGNGQGVVTCLGGVFFVQDGIYRNYGFGIYNGAPTTWTDADGYLPAQITTFGRSGATVSITEFADRLVLGGDAYVAVYSRVKVSNPTGHAVVADPEASPGLLPLNTAPDLVPAHSSVAHDYVVAADRFGNDYPWPSAQALAARGQLRPAFRPHAELLESATGRGSRHQRPRRLTRRCLSQRLHLHRDRPQRRPSERRRQRLRERIQPRRRRYPHQSHHRRTFLRCPGAAARGRARWWRPKEGST